MHPAPSVIFFTAFSGLGFGLLAFLGLGMPGLNGWNAFAFYFIAYAFAVGGLLASVTHLANPKNAIKSFSQWRSSWLSREGILAVAALLTTAVYAIGRIFFDTDLGLVGSIGSVLSVATVYSTSMIYTQLKTVPRWNSPTTPFMFLSYSLAGGALLAGQVTLALYLLIVAAIAQLLNWRVGDQRLLNSQTNLGTATGLGNVGVVRQYEPPHSGKNYLLNEMVYVVGRKHAQKVRRISFVAAFLIPVLALLAFRDQPHIGGILAIIFHILGVVGGRWLFFAEARHVVANYYGK
jgi:DMSO reductase anchor subunit